MLYKFKSQACAEVIMLQKNGEQILTLIGKSPAPQGIITVAQISAAITTLQAAIEADAPAPPAIQDQHLAQEIEAQGDQIALRHRAGPFIELLRCSAQAGKDVVWGV